MIRMVGVNDYVLLIKLMINNRITRNLASVKKKKLHCFRRTVISEED